MTRYTHERVSYARRIQEDTSRYTQQLLGDNEALRILTASLRTENQRLREQMALLREEQSLHEMRRRRLESQLEHVEREQESFSSQYMQIEKRSEELTNLYVASHRLHDSLDIEEVFLAIEEILASLVGTEQFALFERASDRQLRLTHAVGVAPAQQEITIGEDEIGTLASKGEVFVATTGDSDDAPALRACIPLMLGEELTGAIAVFGLLSHKPKLEASDREVLEVVSRQAASAVFCARAHARLRQATATA